MWLGTAAFCQSPAVLFGGCRTGLRGYHPLLRKRDRFAHRGTHHASLWLEFPHRRRSSWNARARERLVVSGANVQVVSVAAAALVIRHKQIDGAFIAANLDEGTRHLCGELSALQIAQIFIAPARARRSAEGIGKAVSLSGLRRKMRIPALSSRPKELLRARGGTSGALENGPAPPLSRRSFSKDAAAIVE